MENLITIELDPKSKPNEVHFDIKGEPDNGLDKSIINALRRTLMSSIPSVAFRTKIDNSDLIIKTNNSSLHNEFIADRIGLIPLYINPLDYNKQYLFYLHVKNDNKTPNYTVTSNNFDIYPLKESVDPNSIQGIKIDDYDKGNPLSQKEKSIIFRPFKYKNREEFCPITELKSTNSSVGQELEIYGVPSVSYSHEDAKWQAVSRCTYAFKSDENLFQKVLKENIDINKIAKSNQTKYEKELRISESERYFYRDKNLEPYIYTFHIDGVHFMNSKQLFILSNQIIIETLEKMIGEFPKISTGEKSFISLEESENGIFTLIINGSDDTFGNIIQSFISREMIDDKSILSICGYKKKHPLEDIIIFTISLNRGNKVFTLNKPQQIVAIVEVFNETCNSLIQIFSLIKDEADKKL